MIRISIVNSLFLSISPLLQDFAKWQVFLLTGNVFSLEEFWLDVSKFFYSLQITHVLSGDSA